MILNHSTSPLEMAVPGFELWLPCYEYNNRHTSGSPERLQFHHLWVFSMCPSVVQPTCFSVLLRLYASNKNNLGTLPHLLPSGFSWEKLCYQYLFRPKL